MTTFQVQVRVREEGATGLSGIIPGRIISLSSLPRLVLVLELHDGMDIGLHVEMDTNFRYGFPYESCDIIVPRTAREGWRQEKLKRFSEREPTFVTKRELILPSLMLPSPVAPSFLTPF